MKTLALLNNKGGVGKYQTDPRLTSLRKLAKAVKVTVGDLVDGSPTKRQRGKK